VSVLNLIISNKDKFKNASVPRGGGGQADED
jgi:hypothetical protein